MAYLTISADYAGELSHFQHCQLCNRKLYLGVPNTQNEMTRWYSYVLRVTEGLTAKEAADRAGFDQSAMTRWKQGANADPRFVVQFARAFNQNVLLALTEAELITDEEADLHEVKTGLNDISTHQLLEELARRIDNRHGVQVNPDNH